MMNYDYLYNKEYFGDGLEANHFCDRKLHFRIIENGTILPHKNLSVNGRWTWGVGGILDSNGNHIKSSFTHQNAGTGYTPTEEISKSPMTVIYLGMFFQVWGHCITDNVKFMWFLKSDACKKFFYDCPIIVTIHNLGGGALTLHCPIRSSAC